MARAGKQYDRSIFNSILVPLLVLLAVEIALLVGVVVASGAIPRIERSDHDVISQHIESRRNSLQNYLVGTVGDLEGLAQTVNTAAQELIDEGTVRLSVLDADPAASVPLQMRIVEPMVETLRQKRASGVFVVFSTTDLGGKRDVGAYGKKPGIYIRDLDPAATPSPRNEDLVLERSAPQVVHEFRISTDLAWSVLFDLDNRANTDDYAFIYQVMQPAREAPAPKVASDYAYWGVSPRIGTGQEPVNLCYAIPLILEDGTVYGMVGVDLSADYLKTLLPPTEIFGGQEASYVLARMPLDPESPTTLVLDPLVASSTSADLGIEHGTTFEAERIVDGNHEYRSSGEVYYLHKEDLRLYNTNSPVEDSQWVLLGLIPHGILHQFADNLRLMLAIAAIAMILAGIAGSILIGRGISNPVRALSKEVAGMQGKVSDVVELSTTGIAEIDQLTSAITTLSRDVASARLAEQKRIEHERDYDLLTGLMNRRSFYREAERIFASPEVLKEAAMVMLDLDNLKDINDEYGHDWGDKYIYQAARCFESSVPEETLVARVSGDEFYLLFYGYDSREEIEAHIEHLRRSIPQTEFVYPGGVVGAINASGGVALYLKDGSEFNELMKLADFTMYQVKLAGKNNIAYFDIDSYQRQTSVLAAMAELDELLANYKLAHYHFQPIFDAHTGQVFAYESLMRVSLNSMKSPADVFALARQQDRMLEIERLTWVRTLSCFTELLERGEVEPNAYLFINSIANLSLPAEELAEIAQDYSELMSRVIIEITEADSMDAEATATKKAIPGFTGQFALDDYGSGYNSELKLLELKPHFVKVDISIIRDIDTSSDKQRLVSHVVDYAHERGMQIVAEGIETASELDTCLALGVDLLQGYHLAYPAMAPTSISEEALRQIRNR